MTSDDRSSGENMRVRQAMLDQRAAIEAILREVEAIGQPLSAGDQHRIDRHVAEIARLAEQYQVLRRGETGK